MLFRHTYPLIGQSTLLEYAAAIRFKTGNRGIIAWRDESGNVEDVLIQNNRFKDCASSGMEHAVMLDTPRLGKTFDAAIPCDKNIRFINNTLSRLKPMNRNGRTRICLTSPTVAM